MENPSKAAPDEAAADRAAADEAGADRGGDHAESAGAAGPAGDCCEAGLERVREWTRRTEEYVRREPAKAVGAAVGVGMFLAIFPVFSVLGGVVRVLVSLFRPLLLVLGAVKLYEEYEKRQAAVDAGGEGAEDLGSGDETREV